MSLSGPYIHKNLTIYLVHGEDTLTGKTPLTLEEAMERKLVIVHETKKSTNWRSKTFLQRTKYSCRQATSSKAAGRIGSWPSISSFPANSGRMPIDSFCVEHGRWTARGTESTYEFNSSADYAPSKDLKMAAKSEKSQQKVWARVEESQTN
jgi:hypothetical protein